MPEPLDLSSLIFPTASASVEDTLREIKRSNLSISNRLHSIARDARFAERVSTGTRLPLLANERCGSWYIPPHRRGGSTYFKSTDGHFGQWGCSLRRLNLHIFPTVGRRRGCVIVDSTRRGKSMPDALSKTIPIWICVLNRVLFPDVPASHALQTPRDVVGQSEHDQILARVPGMVMEVQGLGLDLDKLRVDLQEVPMRPVWITPDGKGLLEPVVDGSFHAIVLCTVSGRDSWDGTMSRDDYVQGAADDHESWSGGLDATTFWKHSPELLAASDDELPALIEELVGRPGAHTSLRPPTLIQPTTCISISNHVAAEGFDVVIQCSPAPDPAVAAAMPDGRYYHLACSAVSKVGSRQLRGQLPRLDALGSKLTPSTKVLVACPTGKDLAVGVALAVICLYFLGDGNLSEDLLMRPVPNKMEIKQRLSWIMISMPDASPSRATLQSVNAYLMA